MPPAPSFLIMRFNQQFNIAAQRLVRATLCRHVSGALFRFEGERRFEYAANLLPSFRLHQATLPLNSWYNQALAMFQSRVTVFSEIFNTPAISSLFKPPKYRSSTTWLRRGSISPRRVNASSSK